MDVDIQSSGHKNLHTKPLRSHSRLFDWDPFAKLASFASKRPGIRLGKLKSRWTMVDGLQIHTRVGAEPVPSERGPVVLVHGLAVSSRYFIPTAHHLAPHYPVYAPDLPGFGRSDRPPKVLDVPELAAALRAWMAAVDLDRAVFVGNSMGCQIIADFALRYPECVTSAVLIAPTMDRYARTVLHQFGRLIVDSWREPWSQPLVVLYDYCMTGVYRTLASLHYGLADLIEAKLPRIHVPVLVVRGDRDPIVSQPWAEDVARLIPNGRLVVFPGLAHTVNYSDPVGLIQVMQPYLDADYVWNAEP